VTDSGKVRDKKMVDSIDTGRQHRHQLRVNFCCSISASKELVKGNTLAAKAIVSRSCKRMLDKDKHQTYFPGDQPKKKTPVSF
jgi:hypothetical protein